MEKSIVLYKSKYGAARRYSEMLAEKLGCDAVDTDHVKADALLEYDTIVLCGGIYASGVAGMSFLKKHYNKLQRKRICLFAVGASPYDEKALAQLRQHNLKGDMNALPLFYGRGVWNEAEMTLRDRTLCKLLSKAVSKKAPDDCEPWEKALLSSFGKRCDWVDSSFLLPLLDCLKQQSPSGEN